jgi:hypothetical protein
MPYCSIEEAWGDNFMNNLSPETQYNPSFKTNNFKNIAVNASNENDSNLEEIPKNIKKQIKKIEDQDWSDDSDENTCDERIIYNQDRQNLEKERKRKMEEYEEYSKMINNARSSSSKNKNINSKTNIDRNYDNVVEGFSTNDFLSNNNYNEYSNIDLIIIILLGIFLLFSMDIFVRIGKYMKA